MKKQFGILATLLILLGTVLTVNANNPSDDESCEEEINSCFVVAYGIEALGDPIGYEGQAGKIKFRASYTLANGTQIGATSFELNFVGGGKQILSGLHGGQGWVEAEAMISCYAPVSSVVFRANGIRNGVVCTDLTTKTYANGLCPEYTGIPVVIKGGKGFGG